MCPVVIEPDPNISEVSERLPLISVDLELRPIIFCICFVALLELSIRKDLKLGRVRGSVLQMCLLRNGWCRRSCEDACWK